MANTCTCVTALSINANATLIKPALNVLMNPTDAEQVLLNISMAGTTASDAAGIANQSYMERVSPAQNAARTLDLYNSITNAMGDTIKFVHVRLLVIVNRSLTHSLILGGSNQVPFLAGTTPTLTLPPAADANNPAVLLLVGSKTGWAVTDSSGDKLTLTDGGEDTNAGSYDLLIVGTQTA